MAEKIRRLYRSKDRLIAGVCGGIGEYLGIDPAIVRLLWLLAVFANGIGLLAYVIAWIIIPEAPDKTEKAKAGDSNAGTLVGFLLILLGALLLAREWGWFRWVDWGAAFAVALIVLGALIIAKQVEKK